MNRATTVRLRSVIAGYAALTCVLSTSVREPLAAEQIAAKKCSAAITFVGSQNVCPTAPIQFHVAVSGCRLSSGAFDYTYLAVNKETKIELHRSARWLHGEPNRDQTEQVPLACDTEIYRVTPVGSPSCTCQDP